MQRYGNIALAEYSESCCPESCGSSTVTPDGIERGHKITSRIIKVVKYRVGANEVF
jgi:hypothetical protein